MSGDGPSKDAPPEVVTLDESILAEDEVTVVRRPPIPPAPPVAAPRAATVPPPPPPAPSAEDAARAAAEEKEKEKKKHKVTLRIPDDEVSRPKIPSSNPTPSARVARPSSIPDDSQAALRRASPDDTLELPARAMAGVDTSDERGWTPYQPAVAENGGGVMPVAAKALVDEPPRAPPPSEEIPIQIDVEITAEDEIDHDAETSPHLPVVFDSEEIKIEEGERITDPGEAPEVAPEDLVSVELIPNQAPALGKGAAVVGAAVVVALPKVVTPSTSAAATALAPAAAAPEPVPAVTAQPAPTATAPQAAPAADAPIQAQPIVFVAPVGALAPPPMSDAAIANKKKIRPWWEELFNDDYIRTMAKINDAQIAAEATFIEESLACERGAMVLDLACGTGRHAVELARRGYQVVGYDLSLSMLARASDEAQERGQKINFVQGDMRDMTFEETFDGIYTWNTSFGFFDEEKNGAVVARVHRALKKGGQFLLDVVNRDYIVRQAPSLAWFEGDGCICMDEMQLDFITSRMKVKRTLMMDDGRTKEIEYSIRLYSLHELGKLLHDNGFRVAEVSGRTGTPGVFFGCESPRTLILAEKR